MVAVAVRKHEGPLVARRVVVVLACAAGREVRWWVQGGDLDRRSSACQNGVKTIALVQKLCAIGESNPDLILGRDES